MNKQKIYQCICGLQANKYQKISAHKAGCKIYLQSINKQTDFSCDVCGEHFGNKGALTIHQRKHQGIIIPYERIKIQCEICDQFISKNNITRHLQRHENNPKSFQIKEIYKLDHNDLFCKFCQKECKNKNSLIQHEIRCYINPERKISKGKSSIKGEKSRVPWNRGKTKETDERIARSSDLVKLYYSTHDGSFKGKHHTKESKLKIGKSTSESLTKNYDTGKLTPNHGIGRGKSSYIIINGIKYFCRSTYEFIYALYLYYIEKKEFEIETIKVKAIKENQYGNYFRNDFYIKENNLIVEIKGIKSDKDNLLKESFEMSGYNFIELFESDINKCKQDLINFGIDINKLIIEIINCRKNKTFFVYNLER